MRILFVVTAFYPEQAIGAIRVTKFAKYLVKLGVDVSIISLAPPPWASRDETLKFEELRNLEWDVIDQSYLFKTLLLKARVAAVGSVSANSGKDMTQPSNAFKYKLRRHAHFFYTYAKALDWSKRVVKHVKSKYDGTKYDIIFCSFPSLASPLAGSKLKKLGIGKKLAVDFRDPMSQSINGPFGVGKYIQNSLLKETDITFHISEGVMKNVLGNSQNHNGLLLTNGFDLDDINAAKIGEENRNSSKEIRFVYTGSLYGGKRDFSIFFEALSELKNKGFDMELLSIDYAGPDGKILKKQAEKFQLHKNVIDNGILSRSDAVKLQEKSDICLLATWNSNEEQGVLTGKVFEYFLLKKPVLSIVDGDLTGSEISKVIRETGAGHCCEIANPMSLEDLVYWLSKNINRKMNDGIIQSEYNRQLKNYDIENITSKLYEALNKELETAG